MSTIDQLERLKDFNRKAEKLLSSSIGKGVLSQNIRCSVSWQVGHPMKISSPEFDQELLDAFLLTFRMFVQNNDRISIGRMKELYDELPVRQELKDRFNEARDDLNAFLDSRPIFSTGGTPSSYRMLKETVLFGDLSHINKDKKVIFEKWMSDPFAAPHIWTLFLMVLANFLTVISFIRVLNLESIAEMESNA